MRKDAPAASSETVDTEMNEKFGLMKRPWGVFYAKEKATGKQQSLHTSDRQEARRLLHSMNEAHRDPMVSRQIARAYLCAADPEAKTRTWQHVMDDIILDKKDKTLHRWINANKDKAFKRIKKLPLVETRADDLKAVLRGGTVSTNVYLRRLHNHALNMRWLLEPVLVKKLWPKVEYKEKRAITLEEHRRIVARETNVERRLFYELLWQLGGSQSDIALLRAENINWQERVIYYYRAKTGTLSKLSLDPEHEPILNQLPSSGPLFPYLASVREADRATEFRQRCQGLGISGVTLHSYRYAWAERAQAAGFPERHAQLALGHNSKAVHRAYARHADVTLPSLQEYERRRVAENIIKFPQGAASPVAEPTAERKEMMP
jgi:integrase